MIATNTVNICDHCAKSVEELWVDDDSWHLCPLCWNVYHSCKPRLECNYMTFEKPTHGGKRKGAGRPKTGEPVRDLPKQIRWTNEEWKRVQDHAEFEGLSVSEFQRKCILGKC